MNTMKSGLVLAMSALLMSCAGAENSVEATIRKNVEPKLGEGIKIDSVRETPYAGLYEIRVGPEIRYTDKTGSYLIVGHVFDLKSGSDLTAARIDEVTRIKFSELPVELALKSVKGDGKRVIAVFEDPNCGYCKRFRKDTLAKLDNITVYTFMFNILSPDSTVKSKNIWCSADRSKAWDEWMIEGKQAPAAPDDCKTPNDKVLALGEKLGLEGTPAVFFADGSRIPGVVDAATMERKFAAIKQ
ncbi:thiol:disulfide interchange protein DsbC [Pseudoduganella lurida]|uniref:Thiol:disulfide interchange protein n=1 Tax=Pseudoduganella lurida TaxID=1036180 RepID=A0A562QXM5_9BURK|nr:DsbC family protein [Pseudoduganella lurida]TWI60886.1 thiol:disulfide interchange protein DsbC [Pseudoduganella lurida]